MSFTLGISSQLPAGTSSHIMERLLSSCLTPLLQYLYRNSQEKVIFCLSGYEMEWIEINHPEINVLINNLARRGQIDFLASSFNGVCLQFLPANERASEVEKSSTFIRRRYSRRPNGFWPYLQVWNSSLISTIELCSLSYAMISTSSCMGNQFRQTSPFIMTELGKTIVVIPTNDDFSRLIRESYEKRFSTEILLSEIRKIKIDKNSLCDSVMVNIDQLIYPEVSGYSVIRGIIDYYSEKNLLPQLVDINSLYNDNVMRNGYLPSGLYGWDFRSSFNSANDILLNNNTYLNYYQIINSFRFILKNCSAEKVVKKEITGIITKCLSCYPLFLGENCEISKNNIEKNIFEIAKLMVNNKIPFPSEIDLDNDKFDEFIYHDEGRIVIFDSKGGCASAWIKDNSNNYFRTNSRSKLFSDAITTTTHKEIGLQNQRFNLSFSDRKNTGISACLPGFSKENLSLSINKNFEFSESKMVFSLKIRNENAKPMSFRYSLNIPLYGKPLAGEGRMSQVTFNAFNEDPKVNDLITISTDNFPFTLDSREFSGMVQTPVVNLEKFLYTENKFQWDVQIGSLGIFEQNLIIEFNSEVNK